MLRAQTIQIYLPSGDPAGLRVANLTTRTARVFDVTVLETNLRDLNRLPLSEWTIVATGERNATACFRAVTAKEDSIRESIE